MTDKQLMLNELKAMMEEVKKALAFNHGMQSEWLRF